MRSQLCLHTQAVNLHPSGMSQAILLKLLQHWEQTGEFEGHVDKVVEFYRGQREAFLAAADKHLTGLAEWTTPQVR